MIEGNTWPEQEAFLKWLKDNDIDPMWIEGEQLEMLLAVSKYRIETQVELENIKNKFLVYREALTACVAVMECNDPGQACLVRAKRLLKGE